MKDIQVSDHNLQDFIGELEQEILEHKLVLVSTQPFKTGKWGLARLWRMWVSKVAEHMASNGITMPLMIKSDGTFYGKRPFNAKDAHELFTMQFLGVNEQGQRLSWAKSKTEHERPATKGERFNALRKLEVFSLERGIQLFKPRNSEYSELENKQEE